MYNKISRWCRLPCPSATPPPHPSSARLEYREPRVCERDLVGASSSMRERRGLATAVSNMRERGQLQQYQV